MKGGITMAIAPEYIQRTMDNVNSDFAQQIRVFSLAIEGLSKNLNEAESVADIGDMSRKDYLEEARKEHYKLKLVE